ncbi:MAG: transglutaminase-like domain-containing protein [Candidatus Hadarchaeota archaeon]
MKTATLAFAAVVLTGLATSAAASGSSYYKFYDRSFTIKENKSLVVSDTITLVNTSSNTLITSVTWTIPTAEISDVQVRDDVGPLDFTKTTIGASTRLQIFFRGSGIGPGSELTYYVSYTAEGMVLGNAVEYRAGLGGITAGESRYDNYIVRIRGPSGSRFFLSTPTANLVENDPPLLGYSTAVPAGGSFEGLRVRFYRQPAYYKVRLNYSLTNSGASSTTGLTLDTILFNHGIPWQSSATASSSIPMKTMYLDEENNLHGVLKIDEIPPGQTLNFWVDLIYDVSLYEPNLGPDDVGEILDVPQSLSGYLKPDNMWDSSSALIQQHVSQLLGVQPKNFDVYSVSENISQHAVDVLDYELQNVRQGSLWALTNGKGDCSEYTDLSIAMARAAGIPARALYGWGYYEEENLRGHAWLEFYFPNKGWQPADPTWRETTGDYFSRLDPIHLTRNVNGLQSSESGASIFYYGLPPGFNESENITPVSSSDAAQMYLSAATLQAGIAENLLGNSENASLKSALLQAKAELALAQSSANENTRILRAKNSIQSSMAVIDALGVAPTTQSTINIELLILIVGLSLAFAAVGIAAYTLWRRVRGR